MKMVIYKSVDGYYMTTEKNYNAYIQDARKIKKLQGVNSLEDIEQFINNCCVWYGDKPENYIVIR